MVRGLGWGTLTTDAFQDVGLSIHGPSFYKSQATLKSLPLLLCFREWSCYKIIRGLDKIIWKYYEQKS